MLSSKSPPPSSFELPSALEPEPKLFVRPPSISALAVMPPVAAAAAMFRTEVPTFVPKFSRPPKICLKRSQSVSTFCSLNRPAL